MIDTHTHFNSSVLKNLREEINKVNNLSYLDCVINVGLDEKTNKEVVAIAANEEKFYAALGIHPLYEGNVESILKFYQYNAHQNKIVALGETGLDASSDLKPQIKKFIETIELANFLKLPIIIHGNNTNHIILDTLKRHPVHHGFVFHCFQPDLSILEETIKKDGYISVGTPITRPTAKKSLEVIANIPLDYLLIELDYPYMSSDPTLNGKAVFNKIKEIRGIQHQELEKILDNNARRLFKKLG